MAEHKSPSGQLSPYFRLAPCIDWMLLLVPLAVPPIGWAVLSVENLVRLLQATLLFLYVLQLGKLWCQKHVLTLESSARSGLAAKAARLYFMHLRASYLRSGVRVLICTLVVNVLIVITQPRNAASFLWLLMLPIVCFSLVSARMTLCHRSVKHGSFGTDELDVHEFAEFLLQKQVRDTPPAGRRNLLSHKGARMHMDSELHGLTEIAGAQTP